MAIQLHCADWQRARLLDNSERLERSGHRLDQSYKTCIETGTDLFRTVYLSNYCHDNTFVVLICHDANLLYSYQVDLFG